MLKDWELKYDTALNKWVWKDIRLLVEEKEDKHKAKNGYFPYEFNFMRFAKSGVSQCSYCGLFAISRRLTRDHIYPKSKGGTVTTPACRPCNDIKRDYLPIDFAIRHSESGRAFAVIPIGYDPLEPLE